MKTFQVLNDALIYSIITSSQYIRLQYLQDKEWDEYNPNRYLRNPLNHKELLRFYVMLMETGLYRSEYEYQSTLKILAIRNTNDANSSKHVPHASCLSRASKGCCPPG